jgi:adenine C2-methylase RlmN of 23S rRNA A2503 and tRNA A37
MQGMGELMINYNALVEAIGVFIGPPFQLSPKRITVSTVSILNQLLICL